MITSNHQNRCKIKKYVKTPAGCIFWRQGFKGGVGAVVLISLADRGFGNRPSHCHFLAEQTNYCPKSCHQTRWGQWPSWSHRIPEQLKKNMLCWGDRQINHCRDGLQSWWRCVRCASPWTSFPEYVQKVMQNLPKNHTITIPTPKQHIQYISCHKTRMANWLALQYPRPLITLLHPIPLHVWLAETLAAHHGHIPRSIHI